MKWLLLVGLAAYLASGLTPIGAGERGVAQRFGRITARPGPGLYFARPWGFERVTRVNAAEARQARVGVDDPAGAVFLTGDANLIAAKLTVEYAVGPSDADLDQFVAAGEIVGPRVARHAESLVAEWAAGQPIDSALLEGRVGLAAWVSERLPDRTAADQLGVRVARVSVESLAAPPEVREAFDAVAQAQNAARVAENQAQLIAQSRRAAAESLAQKLKVDAASYRASEAAAAAAERDAFLARLTARPSREFDAIWWDEMGKLFTAMRVNGRVRPLDHKLGPNGLDVTEFAPP